MSEAQAPSLGDFFKSKAKKKVKASNLNKDTPAAKPEEKKSNKKSAEDDAWEEDEVKGATIKGVESAGAIKKEEETKDDGDSAAPAWGPLKTNKEGSDKLNERKYPTLAKAVGSTAITMDSGEAKINIGTSKNVFAALEGDESGDEDGKKPKSIKPAMVSKKKGEREKDAVTREVKKFVADKKKRDAKKDKDDDEDEDDEEEEEEAEEAEDAAEEEQKDEARKKKQVEKKDKVADEKKAKKASPDAKELEEDLKIVLDTVASKAKYTGRKRLPMKEIPAEELEEEKENRPVAAAKSGGKKKKFGAIDEEDDKKLLVAPDGW